MANAAGAPRLFHRLFIANRGEVAVRIATACDAMGITPVFAVSEADRDAPHLQGRELVCVGPARSTQSYLDLSTMVQAAVQSRGAGRPPTHPPRDFFTLFFFNRELWWYH